MQPLVLELKPVPDVMESFQRFKNLPGCLLLDSAMPIQSPALHALGRYSFLMADPWDWIVAPVGHPDPMARIRERLQQTSVSTVPDLPPFQGGVAGLLSYDLNRSFESLPAPSHDEFQLPALVMGCYDTVVAWDHEIDRAWIISTGAHADDGSGQRKAAQSRLDFFSKRLSTPTPEPHPPNPNPSDRIDVAQQFSVPGPEGLTSNFSADDYLDAVQHCIDYTYAGDIFQVNLAQRLLFPAHSHASELYRRLRRCNPAPFCAYFDIPGFDIPHSSPSDGIQIVSASPERFISVRQGNVETRPIKGTRRRTGTPMVDIHAKGRLESSVKDRAENTMIVDLMRNDLSRCCTDDSIRVTQLCELEQYQSVLHLVSAVQGTLRPDCDAVDLVASIFPGGSITGAPKIRAMEIVAQLEPTARGAYCGALGYFGFDGSADFSILIRTITAAGGWWQIPVGGGIVSQSNPKGEYEETWTKAAGMLQALAR